MITAEEMRPAQNTMTELFVDETFTVDQIELKTVIQTCLELRDEEVVRIDAEHHAQHRRLSQIMWVAQKINEENRPVLISRHAAWVSDCLHREAHTVMPNDYAGRLVVSACRLHTGEAGSVIRGLGIWEVPKDTARVSASSQEESSVY
jgi:hypothetical protein